MKTIVTYYTKRILSLLMAICVLLLPTAAFGEPAGPAAENGKLRIACLNNAFVGGKIEYKFSDEESFTEVGTTVNEEDSSTSYNSVALTDKTSIIVRLTPNEGYKLDEGRGVKITANGASTIVEIKSDSTEDWAALTSTGYTVNLSQDSTSNAVDVNNSSFELEFGFSESPKRELSIGCISNIDVGGTVKYQFEGDTGFTTAVVQTNPEDSTKYYDPIDLGENTAITIKIEPKAEYRTEDVRLRENGVGNTATDEQMNALLSETGLKYDLSSEVTSFSFEFAFRSKLEDGNRPFLGEYDGGTYVENIPFTVTGDINFCINDSLFYSDEDIKASTDGLKADYHYAGDTVDFYVECHINRKYTKLTINGTDYLNQIPTSADGLLAAVQGQLYRFKITVARADNYNIESATGEVSGEEMVVGNFSWWYDSTRTDNDDDVISNGTMELVGIEFNGAPFVETEFLCWDENEDGSGGSAVLPAGAKVTVKIIPEYGYQLTSFELNGNPFETGEEQSVFTFAVGNGNFHLGAKITNVDDVVVANSEAVAGGEITIGDGEIDTGSVQLTVEDNADDGLRNEFEAVELDPGFAVQSVLNIDLKQVLYKGSMDKFWETDMHTLEKGKAQISFDLADAFGNVVILHKKGDGSIEKIIPSYENGRITFETDSFSPFALAVVESEDPKYQIGFDSRGEEDCVSVRIGSGTAVAAVPWASRTYTSGDSTFTITINVPEDRKEYKPLVSVERMVSEDEPMDAFEPALSGRNGVYSFSFVPNRKFSVSNADFVVIINWSEYDAIWANDEQFCIKTINVTPELGDIEILTDGIKSVSLGDETKTLYDRQETEFTVNIKFTPKPGIVRLSKLFVGESELSADGGQITALGADGSFTYAVTVPAKGDAVDSNLDIAAEFDENVAVASISVQTSPAVTTYSIGEDIDVVGGQIKVTYDNGWSEVIDMEPEMITSFDSSTAGTKTVTVSFEGKTTTFTVEVVETARVDAPVISPDGGTFTGSTTVTITCSTDSAKIFYSTDGVEYAEYTAPFTISASATVYAYATKDELLDSFTTVAEFTKKASTGGGSSSGGYRPHEPTENEEEKPQITGEDGKQGWDVITEEIEDAEIGDIVSVQMNGAKVLPKNILDEIKGKNITLVLNMGDGFIWTINGESVTDAASIDMGVSLGSSIPASVINALTGEKEYITIKLNHSGNFGFTAVLTVNMGAKNNGYYANLYYFNELKREAEFMNSGKIRLDGRVKLTFTHASEYIIVIDAADHGSAGGTGDDTSKPDTSDTDNSNSGTGSNGNSGTGSDTSSGNTSGEGTTNPPTGVAVGYGILFVSGTAAIIARKKRNKK